MVGGQHDAVEVLSELVRIGVHAELSFSDTGAEDRGDHVKHVALVAHEPVPHRAGLVIELGCRRDKGAASGLRVPPQPAIDQLTDARLAARRAQHRAGHRLLEMLPSPLQYLQL
jgi:hypothetical protein